MAEILTTLQDFRSAQEIHAALRDRGERVGLATVYRTLARLVAAGEVDVLTTQDGEAVYLHCSREHHHHLVCRSCGRAVAIEGPDVEHWAAGLAEAHGYTEISTTLEVFGRCPRCAATSGREDSGAGPASAATGRSDR